MNRPDGSILVLGLGNVLMGDDGFGPAVVNALKDGFEFPPEVELVDGGTPGLNLTAMMMDRAVLIVVDAITASSTSATPGELRFFRKNDLARQEAKPRMNPHEPALVDVLGFLELAGRGPQEVFVVGAVPESVKLRTSLSFPLRAVVPAGASAVLEELTRLGVYGTISAGGGVGASAGFFEAAGSDAVLGPSPRPMSDAAVMRPLGSSFASIW
jgi:hydrogenase maturation protease